MADAYEDKTYKKLTIKFRKVEDAELIRELEEKSAQGIPKRQWLHDLYYYTPEMPKDLCSIAEVEKLLVMFRIPYRTRVNIIEALKKQCTE